MRLRRGRMWFCKFGWLQCLFFEVCWLVNQTGRFRTDTTKNVRLGNVDAIKIIELLTSHDIAILQHAGTCIWKWMQRIWFYLFRMRRGWFACIAIRTLFVCNGRVKSDRRAETRFYVRTVWMLTSLHDCWMLPCDEIHITTIENRSAAVDNCGRGCVVWLWVKWCAGNTSPNDEHARAYRANWCGATNAIIA